MLKTRSPRVFLLIKNRHKDVKNQNNRRIRTVIEDIGLEGGLPATKVEDLIKIVRDKHLKKYGYPIYLTPKRLGNILSELLNVENKYKMIKGRINEVINKNLKEYYMKFGLKIKKRRENK